MSVADPKPARGFVLLDGLRGIAALAVVTAHADQFFGKLHPQSAYLAVDLFFVLSGFVIAHAYGDALVSMAPARFVRIRFLRLFPLYAAGTLLTVIAVAAALLLTRDARTWTFTGLAISLPLALLMLPSPIGIANTLFPLNMPAWSLFYEMIANAAYAWTIRREGRDARFGWVIAVSAVGLVLQAFILGGLNQGPVWSDGGWTVCRVFYSFPVGVLLHRWHRAGAMPWVRGRLNAAVAVLFLAGLGALLFAKPGEPYRPVFDLLFVLVGSPALVFTAARMQSSSGPVAALCQTLGLVSYPIYALHDPILAVVTGFARRWAPALESTPLQPWSGIAILAVIVAIAWVAGRLDSAVRRRLARLTPPERTGREAEVTFRRNLA